MVINYSKALSLAIALIYVIIALPGLGWFTIGRCVILVPPLFLIWFADELSHFTAYFLYSRVRQDSPPFLIAARGWFFLVGMPLIIFFIQR